MSLRHALLALLEAGPLTGYELAKQFDKSVAYVWHAQHSQIYTELRKLERMGMVSAAEQARGASATAIKRAYRLTAEGAAELARWVGEIEPEMPHRDPWHVKSLYLEYVSLDQARAQLLAHRSYWQQVRDRYEEHAQHIARHETALIRRRLAKAPPEAHEAITAYKLLTYRSLIEHARVEVAWADEGLGLVERLRITAGQGDRPVLLPVGKDATAEPSAGGVIERACRCDRER
jgi:PadR family transcriptional regulator AphA